MIEKVFLQKVLPDGQVDLLQPAEGKLKILVYDALGSVFFATDRVRITTTPKDFPVYDVFVEPCTDAECSSNFVHVYKVSLMQD